MTESKPEPQEPKHDIVAVANKKRHIYLLEKLKTGKTLSRSELKELQTFEGQDPDPGIVNTVEQVAKALEVSVRSVMYWKRDGMPVTPEGKYSIADIQSWRMARGRDEDASEGDALKDELNSKLIQIKIKREQVKLDKELGELIAKSEVEGVLVQLISSFKRSFLSIGRSLAPQLVGLEPREIDAIITAKVRQIIQDFSEGKRLFKK